MLGAFWEKEVGCAWVQCPRSFALLWFPGSVSAQGGGAWRWGSRIGYAARTCNQASMLAGASAVQSERCRAYKLQQPL